MPARFAVCELVLRQGSFADDVAVAKGAGAGAIGVSADAVEAVGVDEARRILGDEGIQVSSYMGLEPILQGESGTADLDETARRLDIAAALGAPGALAITGPLRGLNPSDAEARCREWLPRAAAIAVDRGIRVMLEPIHPLLRHLSFVHTLADGLAMVQGIDGAGVVLDVGHVWWERGIETLISDHVADIVSVQLTNVDAAALTDARYERASLATGDIPVASLVRLLESSGYKGWYEEEVLVRSRRDQRLDMLRASREWFDAV
jgi:sugar phosphate isomerase/epimerase